MDNITQYYIFGSKVKDQDINTVTAAASTFINRETLYFGIDYGLNELEDIFRFFNNNPVTTNMVQIFLIGSSSFSCKTFLNEESFLRRYPLTSTFLKLARDGEERDSQSFHKVYKNINLYIINLYTKHKDTITFEL
tara:strand:- start:2063 stop:2470 length:408 start_codon:yes stop_codon:yes gene_type:complete